MEYEKSSKWQGGYFKIIFLEQYMVLNFYINEPCVVARF